MTIHIDFDGGTFEWDPRKERGNIVKHGLSFQAALQVFQDPKRITLVDKKHSHSETRWLCFGKVGDKVATVRITFRKSKIRILGAGFWRKGRKIYEKENAQKKN